MVFLVILLVCLILQIFLPWWIMVIVSFAVCGLIAKTGKIALWSSFFAIAVLWTGMALIESIPNDHVLSGRVAEMLGLGAWWQVLIVMAILGAFTAAVSGFCGYQFRKAILVLKHKE